MNYRGDRWRAALILALSCIFSLLWFGRFLVFSPVASVDLPGHVALIERLAASLQQGRIFFYDHWWFSGWPAYQFYGFFGHLVTILIVPITAALSREPVQLAVNMIMLVGCAGLPLSLFAAANSLASSRTRVDATPRFGHSIIALTSAVASFWYLNQPLDFFGVGAGSLWHGGLYMQIFAWHLSLLFWAVLFRLSDERRPALLATAIVLLTALVLTHIFAAVFSLALAVLIFLRFRESRGRIVILLFLSAALSAFWWLPLAATAGEYTLAHSEPPQGDLFEMIVHQPFASFALGVVRLMRLQFAPVEIAPLLFLIIGLASLSSMRFWNSPRLVAGALFSLLLLTVLSSPYIAASFPLGLHYYRFNSLLMLFMLALCAASSLELFRHPVGWRFERIVRSGYLILCLLSLAMTAAIGELRGRSVSKLDEKSSFRAQYQVLGYLSKSAGNGRVAFEYFRDRQVFPFLSPHFMESSLGTYTGRETTNGLFIQSVLSTQFVAASLKALGFDAYRVPVPWSEDPAIDRALALRQLRDAGVGQLVVSSSAAALELAKDRPQRPVQFGPYHVLGLSERPPPMIEKESRRVISYLDQLGGVPFVQIENIFYRDQALYQNSILLTGNDDQLRLLPESTQLRHALPGREGDLTFQMPTDRLSSVEGMIARRTVNTAEVVRRELEKEILPSLRALPEVPGTRSEPGVPPEVKFSPEKGMFILSHLEPGSMYRLAYSYFPYFRPSGGKLFRALGDQMVVISDGDSMTLEYARFSDPIVLLSAIVSCTGAGALLILLLWMKLRATRESEPGGAENILEGVHG